jgi:hypothetical protein
MFCTYCSKENPDYAEFCSNCGRRLEKEIHTPPAAIILVPGERVSNGQAPAKQVAVLDRVSSSSQQSFKEQPNVPASAAPFQQAQPSERFNPPSDQQSSLSDEVLPAVLSTPISMPRHNVATLPIQTSGKSPPTSSPPKKGLRGKLPKKWRTFALIGLIILLVGGSGTFLISWLTSVLPAATAIVTITPASQSLTKLYDIEAVTGTPFASEHQVQARPLSFTTPAQSKTVKATGNGHQEAAVAKGELWINSIQGTIPAGWESLLSNSGVAIYYYVATPVTSMTSVDAFARDPGSAGNIPAFDVNNYYPTLDKSAIYFVKNIQAFSGGQDAHDYTFVQQSDIDDAATALTTQLTSDAQSAVQKQIRANEQFVRTPECTPNIKANHKANDRAAGVTVTVTVICNGEVYDQQAAKSMAADWFRSDATSQLGAHYASVGDIVIGTPLVMTTDVRGTVTLNISAKGIWVYQFSEAQKQTFVQLIAGKPLADAQALLLKQEGVGKVNLTTAGGWGSALPSSPNDIEFNVLSVPGLRATV